MGPEDTSKGCTMNFIKSKTIFNGSHSDEIEKRNVKGRSPDDRALSGEHNDDDYMIKCLFVCLSQKIITSHFRAERWRREVSRP